VDAKHLSPEDYGRLRRFLTTVGTLFKEYWEQRGIDFSKEPMEMELGELGEGGMLLKNERGELTPIGSGLFGSTGYFVPPAMCGGYVAGTEAAKDALKLKTLVEVDTAQVADEKETVLAPLKMETEYTPKRFEDMIRQVMTYYAGFIRNEHGMKTGLNSLNLLEEHVNEIKAENPHELMRANEAVTLLKHCQLALAACIARKESGRGLNYTRSDYPNLDKGWDNRFVVQWQEEGQSKMEVITTDSIVD
jgi:succinate dehydrogenase/fumarate reductase flavoprotein subunit